MRVKALTEEGDVVTLPSVDKCVEQFHIIGELAVEKGIMGRSNSVINFRTLESDNPASDSYWENPDLYRRYTLPKSFKPNFTAISSGFSTQQQKQQQQFIVIDDLPALAISSSSMTSSLDSISTVGDDFLNGLKRQTSIINLGLQALYYEPRAQQSLGDLYVRNLYPDPKKSTSLKNLNLRELYAEPIQRSPSLRNFCLKELYTSECEFDKSLGDFYLKGMFKESHNEPSFDLTDLHLDRLFKEQTSLRNKMKKLVKKTIVRPLRNIRSAFSRLNCLAGRNQ